MECKSESTENDTTTSVGNNRYIMECKYRKIGKKWLKRLGINRYIMECKCHSRVFIFGLES